MPARRDGAGVALGLKDSLRSVPERSFCGGASRASRVVGVVGVVWAWHGEIGGMGDEEGDLGSWIKPRFFGSRNINRIFFFFS